MQAYRSAFAAIAVSAMVTATLWAATATAQIIDLGYPARNAAHTMCGVC